MMGPLLDRGGTETEVHLSDEDAPTEYSPELLREPVLDPDDPNFDTGAVLAFLAAQKRQWNNVKR